MKQIPASKMPLVDIPYQAHMDYIYNAESGDSIRILFCTKYKTYIALIVQTLAAVSQLIVLQMNSKNK